MAAISKDNRIVHGMWFGTRLSRMERLTLHSFAHFGHEFHLWAYDDLSHYEFPRGVILRDANEIVPRKDVFAKSDLDAETGVGRNSFGAPFSDLFRYKLLYKHGGIWVDMDVTCLRPFDFAGEYVFRPHRIGVVGSILKCPAGSRFIRKLYNETARTVDAGSDYMLANRILTRFVHEHELQSFIVENISNPDHWMEYIRPLIEGQAEIPRAWYAIHWINEMWRTLETENGIYRGKKLLDYVPDKDAPRPHSMLWEFYRKYDLIDPRDGPPRPSQIPAKLAGSGPSLPIRFLKDQPRTPTNLNVLLPSLVRGGAERSVLETMSALQHLGGLEQRLFVTYRSQRRYPLSAGGNLKVFFADKPDDPQASMRSLALELLQASAPVVYTHLVPAADLRHLWNMGIATVPVIQNMSQGWNDPPSAFDDPHVPFIVGVSDAVSMELRASGCRKPVVTLRHELQRSYAPAELEKHRRDVRSRYGVSDGTLLIGMAGQFKSQKAYTRAVRVLHRIRQTLPAKLMILGGWDHNYGGGRAAYEATCRLAVDLGVIADMIMPGDVHPAEPFFAAFDVFLNTSIYEGLSVALLEAIGTGCPVVIADAGGDREALPAGGILVTDGTDIEAYAQGILQVANRAERALPPRPPDPALIPRLWTLIAKHGAGNSLKRLDAPSGTLFLTQNLHIGGAQTSLVNLLAGLGSDVKTALCTLEGMPLASHKRKLDEAQVPIFSAEGIAGIADRAEFILNWVDILHVRNLCFWNVAPEIKLVLAKILSVRDIRLFDVSPGAMLFDELEAAAQFQRRISLSETQYFQRLDGFVAKYDGGAPPRSARIDPARVYLIPNGVAPPPSFVPLPSPELLLPRHRDSALQIGTCCRIVPDKRIEFLLETMRIVAELSPAASLTIVGGPDSENLVYFEELRGRMRDSGLDNIFFAGEHEDVMPFLGQFQIFVLVSDRQGCPNASLEAMAMGLPVVANRSGGVAEQVKDGVNGYLISTPAEMAARIAELLKNKRLRKKMGQAGRAIALKHFPLEEMIERYRRLFGDGMTLSPHGRNNAKGRMV